MARPSRRSNKLFRDSVTTQLPSDFYASGTGPQSARDEFFSTFVPEESGGQSTESESSTSSAGDGTSGKTESQKPSEIASSEASPPSTQIALSPDVAPDIVASGVAPDEPIPTAVGKSWPDLAADILNKHIEDVTLFAMLVVALLIFWYLITQDNGNQLLNSERGIIWLAVKLFFVLTILGVAFALLSIGSSRRRRPLMSAIAGVSVAVASAVACILTIAFLGRSPAQGEPPTSPDRPGKAASEE